VTMLDPNQIRSHFPALARIHNGQPLVYFDGPGGTQVPQLCIDAMVDYLSRCNANAHGAFVTSAESDQIIAQAHDAMADLLNARRPEEIAFGQNMTSLTFSLSRAIGATLQPGDEIILTRLDHDANYTPWLLAAKDRGAVVHVVDINEADCTLNLGDYERFLSSRTRLVAVGYASNSVGTINPVKQIAAMARAVGAWSFVDAVHYAPHGPIDVQDLDCDFLVCSPYKFFGPHLGALYGRLELLELLPAYKVRPADDRPPGRWETGTQSGESLAGLTGTIRYLEWLGQTYPAKAVGDYRSARSATLHAAMQATQEYERHLQEVMLDRLAALPGVRLYGIADRSRLEQRTPTFAIRVGDRHPQDIARYLGDLRICVWDGHYYAPNLTERLGVEASGGMVRIGLVHYNTVEEIGRLHDALSRLRT
jgi:cysteine desulfurase family protein (TIGR01976 family)